MTSHSLGKGQGFSTLCSSCDFGSHTKQVVEEVAGGPASAVLYFTEVQVHIYVFSVSASDVYPSLSLCLGIPCVKSRIFIYFRLHFSNAAAF